MQESQRKATNREASIGKIHGREYGIDFMKIRQNFIKELKLMAFKILKKS